MKKKQFDLIKKVKDRRNILDLNQPQAAVEIGICVYTLRQFEMGGTVSQMTLDKIARWLENTSQS
jgi:DNA-binding XRE family transcriptional regulator